jgi:hypothetical protein
MVETVTKQFVLLNGTSIMVVHGSPKYNEAPYEVAKGRTYDNEEWNQTLNRLAYIPFRRSEREKGESASTHISRDLKAHYTKVNELYEKFNKESIGYGVYTLDNTTKTSIAYKA